MVQNSGRENTIVVPNPSGPLASGVPGFVAGTWELKQRLGNPAVTWEQLIQPSVDMCFEGITVNNHAYHMMHQEKERVMERKSEFRLFADHLAGRFDEDEEVDPDWGKSNKDDSSLNVLRVQKYLNNSRMKELARDNMPFMALEIHGLAEAK